MLIRQNIFPKSVKEMFVMSFVLLIIPLIYYFELFVVLPKYYRQWSFWYNFHFLIGNFILYNLCSNLVAVILCDTSVRRRILPTDLKPDWRFCSVCEIVAPPRSWHCDTCNTCILKRDHHCVFTGCCIGHENHRYFMIFVLYMFLAALYASYYNVHFLWDYITFGSWSSIVKIVFPLATLFLDWTEDQVYVFFVIIVLLGGGFTGALLFFHVDLMLRGLVTHERNQKSKYDQGLWKNMKILLGERWYIVWLSPLIESKLPSDGIYWNDVSSTKLL